MPRAIEQKAGYCAYSRVANSELADAPSGAFAGIYRHFGKRVKLNVSDNFTGYSDGQVNLDYDNGS